jgi:hypothetical protein
MAVVITEGEGRRFITVASLDADWDYLTTFPKYLKGIRVRSIQYIPTLGTDICVLKDGSATGPEIFYADGNNNHVTKYFYGKLMKPYYDVSDTNWCNASATAKIIIDLGGFNE